MIEWIKLKLNLVVDYSSKEEYKKCIKELLENEKVCSMKNYIQHGNITCFDHCLSVSYCSYLLCRKFGYNYYSAARGGLLHDFFLYDWHGEKNYEGLHGFVHPEISLKNANKYFKLNELEKDIIKKHMWPLTLKLPKYKEAYVVSFVDKCCAILEFFNWQCCPTKLVYTQNLNITNLYSEHS